MTVTIVGTLEQIFTSGGETVSEAVHVDFVSPTDVPLPLHESIVFTERNPPVDIRVPLEAHLEDEDAHGLTSVTRVPVSRAGAMAEWTAVRDGTTRAIVLWSTAPLVQVGVEWGLVAVGNTSVVGSGYRSVEVGEDASSAAEGSIAIGPESTVPDTSPRSVAIGEGAFIPPDTPDRAVLASKELWVRPHADADRVDSAVILQAHDGTSRTIRATPANSLTVNGVPVGGGSNTAVWGGISGSISSQLDLSNELAGKEATLGAGTNAQFLRGDKTWAVPPDTKYIEITEEEITSGTSTTFRAITGRRAQSIVNKARNGVALASSLSLVATSGAYADLTGKPSTFPPSAHNHPVGDITASGSPGASTYLRGDGQWATPPNTNTTYSEITEAEITAGTASALRTISGRRAQSIVNKARTDLETTSQLNSRDTANRSRANHTGTQLAATISDFSTTVASHSAVAANTAARHTHSNKAVLDAVTAAYTTAMNTKLSGITAGADMTSAEYLIATSGPATGAKVKPVATGNRAVAIGGGAIADGDYANAMGAEANAVGANSTAIGYQTSSFSNSTAIGYQAITTANNANAIGYGAKVDAVQASALGRFSTVLSTEPFTTEIGGQVLRVLRRDPSRNALAFASSLQLADTTGALHTIGADKDYGLSYDGLAVLSRANHVGNQAIHTITNLQEILDGKPLVVDPGNRSTAIGVDAQAVGNSSFAAGDTAVAFGVNSIAVGVDSDATGLDSTAVGQNADATSTRATAVGRDAKSSGENSSAYGWGALASGTDSIAVGVGSQSDAASSTAVGTNAQATGNSSLAVGHGAEATGENNVAIGVDAQAAGTNSVAVGRDAQATNAASVSVGMDSTSSGLGATAIGFLSSATGWDSAAIGRKSVADGYGSVAIGALASVPITSPNSVAIGLGAEVPENTPETTVIGTQSLRVGYGNSTITLYDASGNPHVIPATVGQTHSYSANASPGAENLTGVGTYATAGVLRSQTLQAMIPAITTGLWDVDVEATAVVYRSVATGGVYLFVGNGTTAISQTLGRLSPQTHAYTLTMFTSPHMGLAAVSPTQVIDMRYTGFSTAGTTHVVNHGWKITARRVY